MIYQIRQGIYSTQKETQKIQTKVTIAVHPFYFKNVNPLGDSEKYKNYRIYLQQKLLGLKSHLIIIEEEHEIDNTLDEIMPFYIGNPLIIPSREGSPDPSRTGWWNIYTCIKEIWDGQNKINLMGGYLWEGETPSERGCLGYAAYRLEEEFKLPVEIIHRLTF